MRQILIKGGPTPPEGQEFCPMCVMFTKALVEKFHADWIGEQLRDQPDGEPLYVPWPVGKDAVEAGLFELGLAEVVGTVGVAPQMGLMKQCWGHVGGLQMNRVQLGSAGDMAALQGQQPHVPLMTGKR
jgi:hypothetical protein